MAVDRPTFSESWYRIAELRPRLRVTVQVHRQHFRGQMWHVLQDPASNQYFRVNSPAYRFVALLDGRRSVADVWGICNEELGDNAPTQGEAIQLLGQLYTSNLLRAELPPDAEGLLQRYRKRKAREIQGFVTNLLFVRIPLIDPDRFLDRWLGIFGRMFTWYGFLAWLVLIVAGLNALAGRVGDLSNQVEGILMPANLPLLYLGMILTKVCHEFGHGFACKRFGRLEGGAGEVHVMGVMFLIFMPLPYVDASSAWAFRSKWRRVVVGCGGMYVELAIAAVAAIIWAKTGVDSALHDVCYNIMFIASVSTLLFNANPLLRFDGYYILSDLLEIPNLQQRSKEYLYYLVKRYIWGVRRARSSAHSSGERAWFVFYGLASTAYRLFILFRILIFLTDRLPKEFKIVALLFAAVSAVMWMAVPVGKFVRYLATNGELARVRRRAVGTTVACLLIIVAAVGVIKAPDRCRVEGIVEPVNMAVVYAETDGFVFGSPLASGTEVAAGADTLLRAQNRDLELRYVELLAERRKLHVQRRIAQTKEPAEVQIIDESIAALSEQITRVEAERTGLTVLAPLNGTWVSPEIERATDAYLQRGQQIGLVADTSKLLIRAVADQQVAAMLKEAYADGYTSVEIRLAGQPEPELAGRFLRPLPAGSRQLPSAALGYAAGGAIRTAVDDRGGTKAADPFFEIRVIPDEKSIAALLSGQRVIVRFNMEPKPLMVQWWRSLLQLLQRRFSI